MIPRPFAEIAGLGIAVPTRIVTNAEFESSLETSDQWIVERTGIRERRYAGPEDTVASLCRSASLIAMERAGIGPNDLDSIVLGTASPDRLLPSTACDLQALLGAHGAAAFDVDAACPGFLYALTVAEGLIASGQSETALVLGAEKLTAITDMTDRSTAILFGDGAGAVVLRRTAGGPGARGLLSTFIKSDGRLGDLLNRPGGGASDPISDKVIRERGVGSFLSRTSDYWHLWANKDESVADHLPEALCGLYKRSLLVIRTQTDNRGAIIAANDSDVLRFNRDTYSYLWPRDGALVAHALDLAGYGEVTRRFFDLCGELMTRDGYLLHKYNPDGSLGSSWHAWSTADGRLELPIQEDETGLPIWALWQHYERDRDIEFVRPLYRKLVRTGADFMSSYREPRTKLPAPSFDLWEERRGIHAWTTAAVWAGLVAARDFAAAFGQHELSKRYGTAAEEIKVATLTHLYDADLGRFVRTLNVLPDGTITKDPTLDISMAGIFLFGMLPADDPRVVATMTALEERLWVRSAIGGIARYENDYYFQQSNDIAAIPGNPWFVATLWVAEYHVAKSRTLADLERAQALLEWCATKALPSGVLAEQVSPLTGDPLSVSPLTWSHAGYVAAIQRYARRSMALKQGLREQAKRSGEVIS